MANKKGKIDKSKRTKGGNIKASARKKHATFKENGKAKYPIYNRRTALNALKLRGHASPSQRKKIFEKAKKYAPKATREARKKDKKQ